jgi:hypothetical protein
MIDDMLPRKIPQRPDNCIFSDLGLCGEKNGEKMGYEEIRENNSPCGFSEHEDCLQHDQTKCRRAEFPVEFDDDTLPLITTLIGEPEGPLRVSELLADIKGYIEEGYDRYPALVLDLTCTIEALFERAFPEMVK